MVNKHSYSYTHLFHKHEHKKNFFSLLVVFKHWPVLNKQFTYAWKMIILLK